MANGNAQFHLVVWHDTGSPDVYQSETFTVVAPDVDTAVDMLRDDIESRGGCVSGIDFQGRSVYRARGVDD